MHSDFTVFREHLAEACRDRKKVLIRFAPRRWICTSRV